MQRKENKIQTIFRQWATTLLGLGICLGLGTGASAMTLDLESPTIQISTFYNGTTLKVRGDMPVGADLLVTLSGPKKNVALKVKGKVAGFLWMNKDDVELENIPAVYMVYTGGNVSCDLPSIGVGYQALIDDIDIKPADADKKFVFAEYVKLMEKSGLYMMRQGAVKYASTGTGEKTYTLTLQIPPKMSAGDYQVKAIAIQDGKIIDQAHQQLRLVLTGLPKFIATLAFQHSLLFGIMAVLIAVAAGLIIGFLFKGGGGAH